MTYHPNAHYHGNTKPIGRARASVVNMDVEVQGPEEGMAAGIQILANRDRRQVEIIGNFGRIMLPAGAWAQFVAAINAADEVIGIAHDANPEVRS